MPALAAARFLAVAPDLRGEAWSNLPSAAVTRTRRAEDVIALLEALGLSQMRLVGHDIGAITASQLTLYPPARFSPQVMLAVPPPQMKFFLDLVPGMRHLWHQEVIPDAIGADVRLALVEGAGHIVIDGEPDATVTLIVGSSRRRRSCLLPGVQ